MRFSVSLVIVVVVAAVIVSRSEGANVLEPELAADLKDFKDLISPLRLHFLVAKHYILDRNFRQAFNYMRSGQQAITIREQLKATRQFDNVIAYLEAQGILVDDESMRSDRMRNENEEDMLDDIPIPDMPIPIQERTKTSFLVDVLNSVPRLEFQELLLQKSSDSEDFLNFVQVISSDSEFWVLLDEALNSATVKPILAELKAHSVDVMYIVNTLKVYLAQVL